MRVVSLHPDVLVATSRVWQTTCTVVRGREAEHATDPNAADRGEAPSPVLVRMAGAGQVATAGAGQVATAGAGHTAMAGAAHTATAGAGQVATAGAGHTAMAGAAHTAGETFVIDSPILPDELEMLPALLEQARFPQPNGLLATHADWDHLLARLAFPSAALGCAASSAERMRLSPGTPQRELRAFDEEYYVQRVRPLALGSVQALDAPGSCEIGSHELALHPAEGHTSDGMVVWVPWANVLVAGDYLSAVEIPVLGEGGSIDSYRATLERLRPLVAAAEHVVPGHGPVLACERALTVLEEDLAYLSALRDSGAAAQLPEGRRTLAQRRIHAENVSRCPRS